MKKEIKLDNNLIKMKTMLKIFRYKVKNLLEVLPKHLSSYGYKDIVVVNDVNDGYIYVKGELPICLVAHLDTVHKYPPYKINVSKDLVITSPFGIGGDDRCGVIAILSLLRAGLRPSILFTCGEEVGGLGAKRFTEDYETIENVNWFLEIDRRGNNDVVRYSDDNDELTKEFEKFGFKDSWGSFTDISFLCPHFGLSGVNVSSGYYKAHTKREEVHLNDLNNIIGRLIRLLNTDVVNRKIEYKAKVYKSYRSLYDWDSYLSYGSKYMQTRILIDELGSATYVTSLKELIDNDEDYYGVKCEICNEVSYHLNESDCGLICDNCASGYYNAGFLEICESCGFYYDVGALETYCQCCGATLDKSEAERNENDI